MEKLPQLPPPSAEGGILSPQKPVNLLPEVPMQQTRKLTERETKDCEVIGRCSNATLFGFFKIYNERVAGVKKYSNHGKLQDWSF